ncbi:MAG: 5-(carboxyamino)imidazole ribonucleotide synthase [Chitinophagales bacterium]
MEFYNDLKLGVLGGGQLGRMLIQAAMNYNVSIFVLDPDVNAPCKEFSSEFHHGSLNNFDTVYNFGKKVDVLTIEIENVNTDALEKLESEGVKVYPQASVIRLIQDKGLQKEFYKERGIPTAEFFLLDNKEELHDFESFFPAVQKLRKEGYDGRGVFKIKSKGDIEGGFNKPSVLEKLIDFEKEISVIVARNASGEVRTYPTVELDFHPEKNLVEYLFSPAQLSEKLEQEAQELAAKVAKEIDIIGLLAVEMFVTKDGGILVNEIAPRTHNSGHHSIEANITSQFEQHLRSVLNLPLGATDIKTNAVMVNLLGEPGHDGAAKYVGLDEVLATDGVGLHLYGKKFTRPFRKMGHITVVDKDMEEAKRKARFVKNKLKVIS